MILLLGFKTCSIIFPLGYLQIIIWKYLKFMLKVGSNQIASDKARKVVLSRFTQKEASKEIGNRNRIRNYWLSEKQHCNSFVSLRIFERKFGYCYLRSWEWNKLNEKYVVETLTWHWLLIGNVNNTFFLLNEWKYRLATLLFF